MLICLFGSYNSFIVVLTVPLSLTCSLFCGIHHKQVSINIHIVAFLQEGVSLKHLVLLGFEYCKGNLYTLFDQSYMADNTVCIVLYRTHG